MRDLSGLMGGMAAYYGPEVPVPAATPERLSAVLDAGNVRAVVEAGNGTFTIRNFRTGRSFTFTMRVCTESPNVVFVGCNRAFLGTLFMRNRHWAISDRCPGDAYWAAEVFGWMVRRMVWGEGARNVEVTHNGHCAACKAPLSSASEFRAGLHEHCAS